MRYKINKKTKMLHAVSNYNFHNIQPHEIPIYSPLNEKNLSKIFVTIEKNRYKLVKVDEVSLKRRFKRRMVSELRHSIFHVLFKHYWDHHEFFVDRMQCRRSMYFLRYNIPNFFHVFRDIFIAAKNKNYKELENIINAQESEELKENIKIIINYWLKLFWKRSCLEIYRSLKSDILRASSVEELQEYVLDIPMFSIQNDELIQDAGIGIPPFPNLF